MTPTVRMPALFAAAAAAVAAPVLAAAPGNTVI